MDPFHAHVLEAGQLFVPEPQGQPRIQGGVLQLTLREVVGGPIGNLFGLADVQLKHPPTAAGQVQARPLRLHPLLRWQHPTAEQPRRQQGAPNLAPHADSNGGQLLHLKRRVVGHQLGGREAEQGGQLLETGPTNGPAIHHEHRGLAFCHELDQADACTQQGGQGAASAIGPWCCLGVQPDACGWCRQPAVHQMLQALGCAHQSHVHRFRCRVVSEGVGSHRLGGLGAGLPLALGRGLGQQFDLLHLTVQGCLRTS